jgi:hypothetical protein
LAQGPLSGYPLSHLNGSVDYDAETGIWYVDVSTNYMADGQAKNDRYSGTIRWNEDANRKVNGIGWYDVNVRVNERRRQKPMPSLRRVRHRKTSSFRPILPFLDLRARSPISTPSMVTR